MKLIDADKLMAEFDPNNEETLNAIAIRVKIIQQPAAYDLDKVIDQLETLQDIIGYDLLTVQDCLEIVKKGGIE